MYKSWLGWLWMSNQRTKTIINEIHYWKEHNLLPDVFCDFLLALYTEGEGDTLDKQINPEHPERFHVSSFVQLIMTTMTLILSIVVAYNNEINSFLQFILLVGLLLLCFWMYILLKNRLLSQIALIILLIMVLNISIYVIQHFFNSLWMLNTTVLLNFVVWLSIGYRQSEKYLRLLGVLGLVLTIGYMCWKLFIS